MNRKASIVLITPQSGSANRVAAVVYALNGLSIDWQGSKLTLVISGEEDGSVTLPPGDWHFTDGSQVEGGHVFTRDEIGEATVVLSRVWNPLEGI